MHGTGVCTVQVPSAGANPALLDWVHREALQLLQPLHRRRRHRRRH